MIRDNNGTVNLFIKMVNIKKKNNNTRGYTRMQELKDRIVKEGKVLPGVAVLNDK